MTVSLIPYLLMSRTALPPLESVKSGTTTTREKIQRLIKGRNHKGNWSICRAIVNWQLIDYHNSFCAEVAVRSVLY